MFTGSRMSSPDSGLQRRPFKLPSLSMPDASRVFSRTVSSTSSGGRSAQSEPVTPYASNHLNSSVSSQ